jgi:hypothetical protein
MVEVHLSSLTDSVKDRFWYANRASAADERGEGSWTGALPFSHYVHLLFVPLAYGRLRPRPPTSFRRGMRSFHSLHWPLSGTLEDQAASAAAGANPGSAGAG